MHNLWFALWFFLPAGIANVTPIFAAKTPGLKRLSAPIDFGKHFRGKRILGNHKTWRGLITGITMAVLVAGLEGLIYRHINNQQICDMIYPPGLKLGFLLGLGALLGDMAKSLFKRQFNVKPGRSWFPFDQLDYIAGGLLFSAIIVRLTLLQYAWIIAVWFGMHLVSSYIGYRLKLKDAPI
jgi:CDP-2,3-bis-(O-geranylgeranyl)-sn-glycerol synthase